MVHLIHLLSQSVLSNSHVESFLSPLTVLMALSGISIYKNKFQSLFPGIYVPSHFGHNFITAYSVPKSPTGSRLLSSETEGLLEALQLAQYLYTFPLSGKPYSSFVTRSNPTSFMKSFSSTSLACNVPMLVLHHCPDCAFYKYHCALFSDDYSWNI